MPTQIKAGDIAPASIQAEHIQLGAVQALHIEDGSITAAKLDETTPGSALVKRIVAGAHIQINETGADPGTGDVTIDAVFGTGSITRGMLNTAQAGQAAVTRVLPGQNIVINQTGVDTGTGDVGINSYANPDFCSPNGCALIVGQYYDASRGAIAPVTTAGAANRIEVSPFVAARQTKIDRIGVEVTTLLALATQRVVIYDAGADGWPSTLLLETPDLLGSVVAFAEATVNFTFLPGKKYWLGVKYSGTQQVRAIPLGNCYNLGLTSSVGASYHTMLRRTASYAAAAPNPWGFINADRVTGTPPSVRFRVAA